MNDNITEPVPPYGDRSRPDATDAAPDANVTAPLPVTPDAARTVPSVPAPPAPPTQAAGQAPQQQAGPWVAPHQPSAPAPPYGAPTSPSAQGAPAAPSAQGAPVAPSANPASEPRYGAYAPAAQQTQGYPGAAFGLGPVPPAPGPDAPTKAERPRRIWPAVVSTAAATALLVGGGTAALTTAILDDRDGAPAVSATRPGGTSPVSIDSVTPAAWESVAAAVAPSVVAIDVTSSAGESQGSGVIYDAQGHIITNNHVVSGARDDTVQVTLSDGRIYSAKIVGLDPSTDLAVVKLTDPPADLSPATFADSSTVVVGNAVMAVGNPLGLANTVTTGIVSAVARPVTTADESDASSVVVTNAIQIDAAVNPGNSGGPLFNAKGEVIGITSSIATLSSGSQSGSIGLGFAIPSNQAKNVGEQLIANGVAEHAFLGVTLSDSTATVDGTTRRGALVHDVTSGSPADEAGIRSGDVIVAIDGQAVGGYEYLTAAVRERGAGDTATITYVRDGASQDVSVTLAARSSDESSGSGDSSQGGRPGGQQSPGAGPGGTSPSDPGSMSPEELWEWFQNSR